MGGRYADTLVLSEFSIEQSRVIPSHRYEIKRGHGRRMSDLEDGASTIPASDLPPEVETIIEATLTVSGDTIGSAPYQTDALPKGLERAVDEYDYIEYTWEGEPVAVPLEIHANELDRPPLCSFDATLRRVRVTPEQPAVLEFSLTYRGAKPVEFVSPVPAPFGVPFARKRTDEAESVQLWNDEYADEFGASRYDAVHTHPHVGSDYKRRGELQPKETIRTEYLFPCLDGADDGTYEIRGYVRYLPDDCRREVIRYVVSFDLRPE